MTVFSYNLSELKSPLFLTSFTQFLLFALTSRLAQMIELKKKNISENIDFMTYYRQKTT